MTACELAQSHYDNHFHKGMSVCVDELMTIIFTMKYIDCWRNHIMSIFQELIASNNLFNVKKVM